ncbi:tetratricopeptide repeat protein 4 [Holotrichia oblita]|uniref:Tetratricopeptide repeat protein 4 n=1 Tax=Holotrichia oblita TaxID=644536 RepID=A0ACB9SIY2_HOLOL|nr:tetratricopeptide repeat protein 4 [Holotrichia oblita]
MEDKTTKKSMSEEERLELAKKLDKELDEFINNLPKRSPTDKPLEEGWQEELENHPFFMKKPPEPGDKLHPLYEGLQQLKYDPLENTPVELATSYKDDGNFNFKHKNYRLAILAYTEGIKIKCGDIDLEASLLNNRSAAHFYLKNYRSCLRDCELALKLNPTYNKVKIRAANCCFQTEQFDKCIEFCDIILDNEPGNKDVVKLRQDSVHKKKDKERNSRKKELDFKRRLKEEELLLEEIRSRNINIDSKNNSLSIQDLEVHFPALVENKVHLDEENNLVWPVVFLYPEYQTMDFVQSFPENNLLIYYVNEIFSNPAEWDTEKKYTPDKVNVYFENSKLRKVYPVDTQSTLKQILQHEKYLLKAGTPSFIIFSRDSPAEKNFLEKY